MPFFSVSTATFLTSEILYKMFKKEKKMSIHLNPLPSYLLHQQLHDL